MISKLKIGITGGIGSGKSVVSSIFKILGVPVYDADSRAKFLLNNDPGLRSGVEELFGSKAYSSRGLDNVWIASEVFKDEKKLRRLNKLVHPLVGRDFHSWLGEVGDHSYVLKEAALLYESGSYQDLDKIIVITAPEKLRIQRVLIRDPQRSEEQVRDILKRQWPESKKAALADYIINNDNSELLMPQVLRLHEKLMRKMRN